LFAEEASHRTRSTGLSGPTHRHRNTLSILRAEQTNASNGYNRISVERLQRISRVGLSAGCLTPAGSASGSCCIWPVTSVCGKPWPWRRRLHDAFRGRDALETPRGCGVRRPSLHLTHSGFRSASDPTSQPHVTAINRSAARYTCYAQRNGPTPPCLSICLGSKVPA
jgi:hypothetical protein